ncbi:MAG: hypothetical protein JWN34_5864 [Bryobacterales bacterium]|nr:hypothetical protein [Bryobacterales bacterium]
MFRRFALAGLSVSALWAQNAGFENGLYKVMERAGCAACHTGEGVASGTRLHLPEPGSSPAKLEAFGQSLVNLVDRDHPEASLLLRKPTARVTHAGGERIKPGSADEAVLKAWIDRLTKLSGEDLATALRYRQQEDQGEGAVLQDAELRRLTHSQFNHTVRDLLGDQTTPANQFPPEDFVNGFRNQSRGQSLSPILIEAYSSAAERLARSAFQGGDIHKLIPCKPSAACRARFVREFGLKAFRRPLDPGEQQRYEGLMARETDFLKGAQTAVEAMLQSPNFIFRLDTTSDPKLKAYATANRLSYTLIDTMPDPELFAAAASGELSTRTGLEKATRRLLADPRARESLNEFVSQWLRFDRLLTASKDRRKFPMYTRETANAMTEEAKIFFSDLVWNNRNFMTLFTADYGYVNPELARVYGVAAPQRDFDRVPFPATSERAGVLGQGLFLALTAKPEESSPTARGLFVREQFLCQKVPDPPAGVDTNLPPVTEDRPQTNRDRMSEHATNPTCATCHKLIDPIGFGLEKFDAIGARRDEFPLQFTGGRGGPGRGMAARNVNLPIDNNGDVAGLTGARFSSPAQLGALLAKSTQCQECMVKQYFRYTAGRMETPADRPVILKALEDFRSSDFKFQEMIVSLTLLREEGNAHAASNHKSR